MFWNSWRTRSSTKMQLENGLDDDKLIRPSTPTICVSSIRFGVTFVTYVYVS